MSIEMIIVLVVIVSIVLNVFLIKLNISTNKKKKEAEDKASKVKRNIDIILDYQTVDNKIKEQQSKLKDKIIEAKDEKDSKEVISFIRNLYNS